MKVLSRNNRILSVWGIWVIAFFIVNGSIAVRAQAPLQDGFSGLCSGGERLYPAYEIGPRGYGLTGFYFNFKGKTDKHLKGVSARIYPDFNYGKYLYGFGYYDKSGNDDFYYTINWQQLPLDAKMHRVTGTSIVGGISKLLGTVEELPGIPVLTGFRYHFKSKDHHLKRISARVRINHCLGAVYAQIVFEDKSGYDDFDYAFYYAMIPCGNVKKEGYMEGKAKKEKIIEIDADYPLLQGFDLEFTNGDHHMDRLGVILDKNQASVYFHDKNKDDKFKWKVWWVDVQ